jgi:signal transduction histidine kinase
VAFTPFYPKLVLPSLILLFGSFCLSIAISIWFVKQVPGAGLYLAAFGVLMLLIVKRVLTAFGIISDSAIYNNILMFSSLIHILVLNIAIINKAVRNRKEINSAEAAYNSERIVVEQQRQFLRTMSHELRTPLSIIDCTAQILPVLRNDQDKFDKKTSAIRTAAKRMKTILDSNLTNERISLDGFVPNMQVVDLRSLIRNAVSKVNDGTDSHQVQYVLEMFPESFVCDPLLMEILIGNLLDNAVKYSPDEGCITLNSWIGSEKYLYIEITDHGVGISSEHIGLIFNRFYRTGQLPDVTGAGLGLYLAQQIAQQHGGDIACFSVPGKGSTFTVRLWYNC